MNYTINASAVEIYFEKVYDLLNNKNEIFVSGIALNSKKNIREQAYYFGSKSVSELIKD